MANKLLIVAVTTFLFFMLAGTASLHAQLQDYTDTVRIIDFQTENELIGANVHI